MTGALGVLAAVALVVARLAPPLSPVGGVGVLSAAAAAVWSLGRRPERWRRTVAAAVAVAAVVAVAAGSRLHHLAQAPLPGAAGSGSAVDLVLRVVGDPEPTPFGGWRSEVVVLRADGHRSGLRAELVHDQQLAHGTTHVGRATVAPTGDARDRDRHVAVRLRRAELGLAAPAGRLASGTNRVREALAVAAGRALPPGAAGLATGLVTGDTRQLPDDDAEAMRAVGLTHLTAVSGSNVALVVAGTWALVGLVRLGARGRRRATVAVVAVFVVLTRADPSVLRATATAGVALLGAARGRRVEPLHALAGAVLVLVLLDPLLARRLGLVLSAAATLGVLAVAPRVRTRLARLEELPRVARVAGAGRGLDLLAVTLGAQVAVLPVLLAMGEAVALASVPANLVAVPAAAVGSVLATAAAVVAVPWPGLAVLLLRLAGPFLDGVLWSARTMQWWGPSVGLHAPVLLAVTVASGVWAVAAAGTRTARAGGTTSVAGAVVLLLGGLAPPVGPVGGLLVTAIDVGQGDAFLLTAGDTDVLVDTGRDRRAAAWLDAHGPDDLDLLVLTHGDADHTGGVADVLAVADVAAVWQRPRDVAAPPALQVALAALARSGVPVHAPVAGQEVVLGALRLRVLAPTGPDDHVGRESEENESSLVLRVDGPGGAVLLTGDIGPAAHEALLGDPVTRGLLDVDLVTVPHHGSRHVDLGLYAAATAADAVVSVGEDNGYGHPADEVVEAVRRSGARLHRTDRDGTVRVVVRGGGHTHEGAPRATGRVGDHAPLHARDLRRLAAAAPRCRPRPARRARRRRGRAHGRGRGGPARRPDRVPLRR